MRLLWSADVSFLNSINGQTRTIKVTIFIQSVSKENDDDVQVLILNVISFSFIYFSLILNVFKKLVNN